MISIALYFEATVKSNGAIAGNVILFPDPEERGKPPFLGER